MPSDLTQIYAVIAAQSAQYTVQVLCQTLGVSRSGFYTWQQRPTPTDPLTPQVVTTFWRHARRYGSCRLSAELQAAEVAIGRRHVRRIMRTEQLQAIQPKSFVPRTTNSRPRLSCDEREPVARQTQCTGRRGVLYVGQRT